MVKRRVLDRDGVIAQAARMADAAGNLQAVSLTALAAALNIRVPSLYNHIAGLEDLQQALAVYAMQQLNVSLREAVVGHVGEAALAALVYAYRRFAREHPGIYPLILRAPGPGESLLLAQAQELVQMLLLVFASCGLQGADAIHAIRVLRALLHGFATLEAAEGFKMAVDLDESFRRGLAFYLAGVRATRTIAGDETPG